MSTMPVPADHYPSCRCDDCVFGTATNGLIPVAEWVRDHEELLDCTRTREHALASTARIVTDAAHATGTGLVMLLAFLRERDEWQDDVVQAAADRDWTPSIGYLGLAAEQIERLDGLINEVLVELR